MKIQHFFFALPLLFTSLSFVNSAKIGVEEGKAIPQLSYTNSDSNTLIINPQKGKWMVVNLWAAYDANSRMNNVKLFKACQDLENPNLQFVSISFDQNQTIFEETIRLDGIDKTTQHFAKKDENMALFAKLRLQNGFTSYLVDEYGVIVSRDLTQEQLAALALNSSNTMQ